MFKSKTLSLLMLPALLATLSACSLFQGRESTEQYVDDSTITTKVKAAFVGDSKVSAFQINVETMQGVVQLSGFVDSAATEAEAVQLAQNVDGVKTVKDNIILKSLQKTTH